MFPLMSENGGRKSTGFVSRVVGICCEEYPDGCQFAMQAGVFDAGSGVDLFPSMSSHDTCPNCGGGIEDWEPMFDSSVPGRPTDW